MGKVDKAVEKRNPGALIELAQSKDAALRLAAIAGLGKVGGDESTNYLVTQLGNAEPTVRVAVADALGAIGDMHTKAHVSAQISRETDPLVKDAMCKAMANIKGY